MNGITAEEIDILLLECEQEIKDALSRLADIVLERDSLRRKIRVWREEMDVLESMKSGLNFNDSLVDVNPMTMHALQRKYNDAIEKYNDKFAGKEKLKMKAGNSNIREVLENKVRKSARKISQVATIQKLSLAEEKQLHQKITEIFASTESVIRIAQKHNLEPDQLTNLLSIPAQIIARCEETDRWIVDRNSAPADILIYIYKEAGKSIDDLSKKCGVAVVDLIETVNFLTRLVS